MKKLFLAIAAMTSFAFAQIHAIPDNYVYYNLDVKVKYHFILDSLYHAINGKSIYTDRVSGVTLTEGFTGVPGYDGTNPLYTNGNGMDWATGGSFAQLYKDNVAAGDTCYALMITFEPKADITLSSTFQNLVGVGGNVSNYSAAGIGSITGAIADEIIAIQDTLFQRDYSKTPAQLDSGTVYRVMYQWETDRYKIWVNGVEQTTYKQGTVSPIPIRHLFRVGILANNVGKNTGIIYEVVVYKSVLTDSEVEFALSTTLPTNNIVFDKKFKRNSNYNKY